MQRYERASVLRHKSISCLALELPIGAYLKDGYGIGPHRRHSGQQLPSYDMYRTGMPYNGQSKQQFVNFCSEMQLFSKHPPNMGNRFRLYRVTIKEIDTFNVM